jgi:hypothetical protein
MSKRAKKFMDKVTKSLIEQHGIKGVEVDDKFYKTPILELALQATL